MNKKLDSFIEKISMLFLTLSILSAGFVGYELSINTELQKNYMSTYDFSSSSSCNNKKDNNYKKDFYVKH